MDLFALCGRAARAVTLICFFSLAGCGQKSAAASDCAGDPFSCPMGQTCWPIDEHGAFACLPSKSYAHRGDECELIASHTGCPDGMVCLTSDTAPDANAPVSYCTPYCDTKRGHGCAGTETCEARALFEGVSASVVSACVEHDFTPMDGGGSG